MSKYIPKISCREFILKQIQGFWVMIFFKDKNFVIFCFFICIYEPKWWSSLCKNNVMFLYIDIIYYSISTDTYPDFTYSVKTRRLRFLLFQTFYRIHSSKLRCKSGWFVLYQQCSIAIVCLLSASVDASLFPSRKLNRAHHICGSMHF